MHLDFLNDLLFQYGLYAVFILVMVEGDITLLLAGVLAHSAFFGEYSFARVLLWGTVAGGWLMARAALVADSKLGPGGDSDFCRAKIATARFYAEHILPQAAALSSEVVNGASSVLALSEAQF